MSWAKFFMIISFLILLAIWGFTAFTQSALPEIIPIHFDGSGKPDGYGSKHTQWLMVAIATALFGLLYYLFRNPHSVLLNVPEHLRNNKKLLPLFIAVLSNIVMLMFLFIAISTYQVALGIANHVGLVAGLSIAVLFLTIIAFLAYSSYHES